MNLLGASRALCVAMPSPRRPQSEAYITNTLKKLPDVGQKFEYLLNTGNLVSKSGLDLSQSTGFTVRGGEGVPGGGWNEPPGQVVGREDVWNVSRVGQAILKVKGRHWRAAAERLE